MAVTRLRSVLVATALASVVSLAALLSYRSSTALAQASESGAAPPAVGIRWEEVTSTTEFPQAFGGFVYRAKVPGGWLVLFENRSKGYSGLTFCPDPDGHWKATR